MWLPQVATSSCCSELLPSIVTPDKRKPSGMREIMGRKGAKRLEAGGRGQEGKEMPAADRRQFFERPQMVSCQLSRQLSHENQSLTSEFNPLMQLWTVFTKHCFVNQPENY